jgi:hypothetical protein
MNLYDFERHIAKVIIARGEDYFFDRRVKSLTEEVPGHFRAVVIGNDDYKLSIKLDDNNSIIETECDCPFTDGPYCKHMVAVFIALREKKMGPSQPPLYGTGHLSSTSYLTLPDEDSLRQYLSGLPNEQLIDLIMNYVAEFPEIGDRLKACAAPPDEELQYWLNIMRRSIHQAMDHHGFIDFRHCSQAVEGALEAVERAGTALDDGEYELAVNLLTAILEEMASLVQYADDSGGEIGTVTEEVEQLLTLLADYSADETAQEFCFNKLLLSAAKTCFDGWDDWRIALLASAASLVVTKQQRTRLEDYFQSVITNRGGGDSFFGSDYTSETVSFLQYSLISRLDGTDQANDFLYRHLSFPRFRKMAILQKLDAEKYEEAELLALEGEMQDGHLPGLLKQWKNLRFEIYFRGNDLERLRHVATELVLDGYFEYYGKLKATYSPGEWSSIYPKILDEIAKQTRFPEKTYTSILIEENEWEKLLSHVTVRPHLILDYYRHLTPHFPSHVYELFEQVILHQAETASSRPYYQQIASHLRLLQKIGGKQQAQDLTMHLLAKYPRRPAFRDELSQV